jgi:glycosyltransferase EpsE
MLVSVVMATYNDKPESLDTALRSIVDQSFRDWEIVVSDDSTKAESMEVLDRYARLLGDKMTVRHHPKRLGLVASINEALGLARGSLIARMDGDDICLEDRLEVQARYLGEHPEVGILGGNIEIMTEGGEGLSVRRYNSDRQDLRRMSFIRNPIAQPTVMLRREVLDRIGLYDGRFRRAEDYELWLRALKRGVVIENLDRVLIRYRVPEDYSRKRDADNWLFGIKAKLMHFSWRYPLQSIAGLGLSVLLLLAPTRLLDALYHRDHRAAILYNS